VHSKSGNLDAGECAAVRTQPVSCAALRKGRSFATFLLLEADFPSLALVLLQCAPAASKSSVDAQRTPAASPQAAQVSPLRELRPGDRFFAQKVRDIVAHGDPARRMAVGAELTRLANELIDKSWLEASRPRVVAANTAAGLQPAPAQLNAQLEEWRTELLTRILDAMQCVGAPEHVAFAFATANDKSAPLARRKAALRLLDGIVSASDLPAVTHREAVRSELADEERAAEANPSNEVTRVVAHMREPFRLCFQEASAVAVTELPAPMATCVDAVIRASRFAPWAEARRVQVPLTFVPDSQNAASPASTCFPYEPALVELTGVLERRD
jgi:hypothetical protein